MILVEICTEAEYEFLKLWYSCEWKVLEKHSILMIRGDTILFQQDWENNLLWCSYTGVWRFFESRLGYNDLQIKEMISGLLEQHLKTRVLTPRIHSIQLLRCLEQHLKTGRLTLVVTTLTLWLEQHETGILEQHLKKNKQ